MSEQRSSSSWQTWVIGAMGTLLLFISSLYVTNVNASVEDNRKVTQAIQDKQSSDSERIATLEEAVKSISELKQAMKELTNALNETNRHNTR